MARNTTEDSSNRKVRIFRMLSLEHHYVRDFNHVRICHTWSKWSKFSTFGLLFLSILSRKILSVYRLFVLPGGDLYFKEANQLPKH